MQQFNDIEDVEQWLEPMDYQGFWYAVKPFDLTLQDRAHCEQQMAESIVPMETVLFGLKALARKELIQKHRLKHRKQTPWVRLVAGH